MWYSINIGHNIQGIENIRLKHGYQCVSRHKLKFTIDVDVAHWLRGRRMGTEARASIFLMRSPDLVIRRCARSLEADSMGI